MLSQKTIEKELLRFGLSFVETRVYLSLFFFGPSVASSIARRAGMHRSSVYAALGKLQKQGLTSNFRKNGITFFSAVRLARFEDLCEEVILKQRILQKRISHLVQSFNLVGDHILSHQQPIVSYFEGFEGIKSIYYEILRQKNKIYSFLTPLHDCHDWKFFISDIFDKERVNLGISIKFVVSSTIVSSEISISTLSSEIYHCPINDFPDCCHLLVSGSKFAFISFAKDVYIGVFIDHPYFSSVFISLFQFITKKMQ